jgi:hypothetical protein
MLLLFSRAFCNATVKILDVSISKIFPTERLFWRHSGIFAPMERAEESGTLFTMSRIMPKEVFWQIKAPIASGFFTLICMTVTTDMAPEGALSVQT